MLPACGVEGEIIDSDDDREILRDEIVYEPVERELDPSHAFFITPSNEWRNVTFGHAPSHTDFVPVYGSIFGELQDVYGLLQTGARMVSGDFNGDGNQDFALVGGAGWWTIPVFFSNRAEPGTYTSTNEEVYWFPQLARTDQAQIVVGDFNGDRRDDIALVGARGLTSIPMAISRGDGNFVMTNPPAGGAFAEWASRITALIYARAGDFDGDGLDDIALIGGYGSGFWTVPIRYTRDGGQGNYITNDPWPVFVAQAADGTTVPVVGDFNGDRRSDIALFRQQPASSDTWNNPNWDRWHRIPTLISQAGGGFFSANMEHDLFTLWVTQGGCPVVGDFNHDFRDDIALFGGRGWWTVPVAYGTPAGHTFTVINRNAPEVANLASMTPYYAPLPVAEYSFNACRGYRPPDHGVGPW